MRLSGVPMLNILLTARGITPSALYSVETVSEVLGLTPSSVRRLIRRKDLRALRRRRSIIGVTHIDLEGFLSGQQNGGEA